MFSLVLLVATSGLLGELIAFSLANAQSSHVILIPFVSATLIYLNRREIFSDVRYSLPAGGIMMAAGVVLVIVGKIVGARLIQLDYLALMSASVVLLWLGCFLLFCGTAAFRAALFPLLFLVFMIPIPSPLMERLIQFLQKGSTEVVAVLFALSGTPVYREGFLFSLPGLVIEVAKPCSGIRSSLALLITGLLAGHLFLRTGWRRLILIVAVFPIAMFKNAVRIVTLSLLALNVDPRIITSRLHQEGGIPFFILALAMLSPLLGILRKSERRPAFSKSAPRAIDNLRLNSGDFRQGEINPSSVVVHHRSDETS